MTMRSTWMAGGAAALIAVGAGGAAVAGPGQGEAAEVVGQTQVLGCSARTKMIAHLETKFGETFSGASKQSPRGLVELYVSDDGHWTLLLTLPDGQSCPLAVGSDVERDFGPGVMPGERA